MFFKQSVTIYGSTRRNIAKDINLLVKLVNRDLFIVSDVHRFDD
jgi:hypothetical protein